MRATVAAGILGMVMVACAHQTNLVPVPASVPGEATGRVSSATLVVKVIGPDASAEPVRYPVVNVGGTDSTYLGGEDGTVTIEGLKPGRTAVRVRVMGYEIQQPDSVNLTTGHSVHILHKLTGRPPVVKY